MNRRLLLLLVVIVGVAALVVGGYFLLTPARVVEKAADQLGRAETADFTLQLELENDAATERVLSEQGRIEVVVDGDFKRRATAPDDVQAKISFSTITDTVSVRVDGEVRLVDKSIYAYVENAPAIFPTLQQLRGKWLENPRGATADRVAHAVPENLFTNVERTGTEVVNGETVVVYKAIATDEAVISMMDGISEIVSTRLTEKDIEGLRASVQKSGEVPVEIKVRRFSKSLKQIVAPITMPGGNTLRFTLTINDTNQPVNITKPDGAVSFQDAGKNVQNSN